MKRLPVKFTHSVRNRDDAPPDVEPLATEPARERGPFLSFHYTYTEIAAEGGRAQVRRRTTRLQDGKLTSESFEGTVDRSAYNAVVRDLQRSFIEQQTAVLKMFAAFLPFRRTTRDEE